MQEELKELTEAYVVVRYAGEKPSPSRLERVREIWQRVVEVLSTLSAR